MLLLVDGTVAAFVDVVIFVGDDADVLLSDSLSLTFGALALAILLDPTAAKISLAALNNLRRTFGVKPPLESPETLAPVVLSALLLASGKSPIFIKIHNS